MTIVSQQDKHDIRLYVNGTKDKELRKTRRKECAEVYNVPLGTIAAITATDPNLDAMDYDNPIKKKWRTAIKEPIGSQKGKKIFTMPGVMCHEIPMWLDLGANPKDITGVELKKPRIFKARAKRYKINGITGDVREEIKKGQWDTVCLDITGNYSDFLRKCVRCLDCSTLIVNYMAGREHPKHKDHILWSGGKIAEVSKVFGGRNIDLGEMKSQRDFIVPILILSEVEHCFDEKIEQFLQYTNACLEYYLVDRTIRYQVDVFLRSCWMLGKYNKLIKVLDLDRFGYKSPTKHVFLTEIFKLEKYPLEDYTLRIYQKLQKIYEIFNPEYDCRFGVRNYKNLTFLQRGTKMHRKDIIQYGNVASFTLDELLKLSERLFDGTDLIHRVVHGRANFKERIWIT